MAFEMRAATVRFTSRRGSELFFGKPVTTKKDSKQTHEQYDEATWREKISRDSDGNVYWPHFAIKNALECVGQFIGFGSMRIGNGGVNGMSTVELVA